MKAARGLLISITLLLAGTSAFALEAVQWKDKGHSTEFKYFIESRSFTLQTWKELSPEEQDRQLREAREPAQQRLEAIDNYYTSAMALWDTAHLRKYTAQTENQDVSIVNLWLGQEKANAFWKKLSVTRATMDKAEEGLGPSDEAALAPYLTQQAIADLRGIKAASAMRQPRDSETQRKTAAVKARVNSKLNTVSGSVNGPHGQGINKVFDGSTATGNADEVRLGGAYSNRNEIPKGAVNGVVSGVSGQIGGFVGKSAAGALGADQLRTTKAATLKAEIPAPLQGQGTKSTAWTSDAYGYTIEANGKTLTFRDKKEAEAAIRSLPNGSVSKVTLYGHGAPGMQTVGNASYESGDTAALLKDKMAKNGVIQYSGCNTASIGGATLNPAVGLSMVARRILYFSIPYFQDRMDGIPADQAKQQWEKGWNADLSRDTSLKMKGSIVCGYRTFGLVPGRLPGLTRLMGSQEATTPGYVAGKKVCYQDGIEVPEP